MEVVKVPASKMRYDDLFEYIGETGLFQVLVFTVISMQYFWSSDYLVMVFAGYREEYWCRVPALENFTFDHQRNILAPYDEDGYYEGCRRYDLDYSSYTTEELLNWDRTVMVTNQTGIVDCDNGYVFHQEMFASTINNRYELVCGREDLGELVSTIYFAGVLVGSLVWGILNDTIGRKWSVLGGTALKLIGGLMAALSPNYVVFVIGRCIVGFGIAGMQAAFIMLSEMVGPKYRSWYFLGVDPCFALGSVAITGIAYIIRDDMLFQLAITIPNCAFLIMIWALPESPRWLIVKGKYKQAEKILKLMAAVNKREWNNEINFEEIMAAEMEEDQKENQRNCLDIAKYPKLRTIIAVLALNMFVCNLMYYGLTLGSGDLAGDLFVNTILFTIVEIPAYLVCMVIISRPQIGRRFTSSVPLIIGGLASFISIALVLNALGTGITALSVVGKAFISLAWSAVAMYAVELIPTEVRGAGLSVTQLFSRVAGLVAPFIGAPLSAAWAPLPQLVFGLLATVAGVVTMVLPETIGRILPETIEDGEKIEFSLKCRNQNNAVSDFDGKDKKSQQAEDNI